MIDPITAEIADFGRIAKREPNSMGELLANVRKVFSRDMLTNLHVLKVEEYRKQV